MKKRKIPMRKDLLTNTMQPKKELVRVVVDKDKNNSVDPTGKKSGRGAYVSLEPDKIAEAQKNQVLENSLIIKLLLFHLKIEFIAMKLFLIWLV